MSIRYGLLLGLLALLPHTAVADTASVAHAATWISVLPPIIAILLALVLRQVIPALFTGIVIGAWAINGFTLSGLWNGLLDSIQVYVLNALADSDHAAIILFSMMVGGMVGIVSRNGGMQGVVNRIVRWADSARHASLATIGMGMAIFFDDYANTLVVGNTMRSVTDRMHISREKLAYLVDSTAAPIACIALVTTWIGTEVGLIADAIDKIPELQLDAYWVFLSSIPYSFYPLLAIAMVLIVALTGRDFGPMLTAERHARQHGVQQTALESEDDSATNHDIIHPVADRPQRAVNAIVPVLLLIASVVAGLYVTGNQALEEGTEPSLRNIIGNADSYKALLWGSLLGVLAAAIMSIGQGILNLKQVVDAWYQGIKSMLYAMVILLLAWSLGAITEELQTAQFLVEALDKILIPQLLPALVFVLAALTAFATGSSWGTMGILIPLVVPLTWAVLQSNGMTDPSDLPILYSAIACVLGGAVWGDHCSPISDTTIMSSMASGCDHIQHVRTQLPYAMLCGTVAIALGTLPSAYGLPWWLALALGIGSLLLFMRVVAKPVETAAITGATNES